ncbi:MAG: macro domain-containing protein [Parvibaculum sp.]
MIHCLGPVFGRDKPADDLLAACYRDALHLAEQTSIVSIAFPAISTGAFGYPLKRRHASRCRRFWTSCLGLRLSSTFDLCCSPPPTSRRTARS